MNKKIAIAIFITLVLIMTASTLYSIVYYQQKNNSTVSKDEVLDR